MRKVSDWQRLRQAFNDLEAKGYSTSFGRICCNGCTTAYLAQRYPDRHKAVWFTQQDQATYFPRRGNLQDDMYLGWDGDLDEICSVLEENGFELERPQDKAVKILIMKRETNDTRADSDASGR
jgi:hypothetical protein